MKTYTIPDEIFVYDIKKPSQVDFKKNNAFQIDPYASKKRKSFKNEPIEGLKILRNAKPHECTSWNHMGHKISSGDTYDDKIIQDPRGFLFCINSRDICDLLLHGVQIDNSEIKAPVVFAKTTGRLQLLAVNTAAYKISAEKTKLLNAPCIDPSNLKIGSMYRTRNDSEFIYLGKYWVYFDGDDYRNNYFGVIQCHAKYNIALKKITMNTSSISAIEEVASDIDCGSHLNVIKKNYEIYDNITIIPLAAKKKRQETDMTCFKRGNIYYYYNGAYYTNSYFRGRTYTEVNVSHAYILDPATNTWRFKIINKDMIMNASDILNRVCLRFTKE